MIYSHRTSASWKDKSLYGEVGFSAKRSLRRLISSPLDVDENCADFTLVRINKGNARNNLCPGDV
jgi:hypothetical protein